MREFAIGDIHGCIGALHQLLEMIQPQKADTIVFLGDYVDRGPDSCGVIDTIIELNRKCTVVSLIGNHEEMMLDSRNNPDAFKEWLNQGGRATLQSYGSRGFGGSLGGVPEAHWDFLNSQVRDYWETDRNIFVHASLDPKLDMVEQSDLLLRWQVFRDPTRHKSGKQIVCGHTSQKLGWPAIFDGGVCIDTYAYGGKWLTCFDLSAQKFIQANERGEHRLFDFPSVKEK
jgi:serine/threonine protein phosphatase 1